MVLEKDKNFYCTMYILNEILFGQSKDNIQDMIKNMEIDINFSLDRGYLILTGIKKSVLFNQLGIQRGKGFINIVNNLNETLIEISNKQHFKFNITVVNYDGSKLIAIFISTEEEEYNIQTIVDIISETLEKLYLRYASDTDLFFRNTTIASNKITCFSEYHSEFYRIKDIYDKTFFCYGSKCISCKRNEKINQYSSQIEIFDVVDQIESVIYQKDRDEFRKLMSHLFDSMIKCSHDFKLLFDVLAILKKKIYDFILILDMDLDKYEEVEKLFKIEGYFSIEQMKEKIQNFIEENFIDGEIYMHKVNSLTVSAIMYIKNNFKMEINLESVASHIHVNAAYLSRVFKQDMEIGMVQYINNLKIQEAKRLLENTDFTTLSIAREIGVTSVQYFNRVFKQYTGITPQEYRKCRTIN